MMTGDDDGDDNDYNGKVAEALLPDYWAAKGSHTWSMLHYWSDTTMPDATSVTIISMLISQD